MARYASKYRCPDCGQAFSWYRDQPPPDYCPRCGSYVGPTDEPFEPKAPAVHTKARSLDGVYRQIEASSEKRAREAADMLGVSVSDVPNIKITNMKDRPHEGEHSAVVPAGNQVERLMAQAPPGLVGNTPSGQQFAATVAAGPFPRAGSQAMTGVWDHFRHKGRAFVAENTLNRK